MMNNVCETLMAARDMIKDERNWCQNTASRDDKQNAVPATSDSAVSYCAVGALYVAARSVYKDNFNLRTYCPIIDILVDQLSGMSILKFNDDPNTNHKDVVNLFTNAINSELSKGE